MLEMLQTLLTLSHNVWAYSVKNTKLWALAIYKIFVDTPDSSAKKNLPDHPFPAISGKV